MGWTVSMKLLSEPHAMRVARKMTRALVEQEGGPALAQRIELAVGEALMNARVHAYPDGHMGRIEILVSCDDTVITLTVVDRGKTRSVPVVPDSIHIDGHRASLGLGLYLMSAMVDRLEIGHTGDQPGEGLSVRMIQTLRPREEKTEHRFHTA
jgi:anti-sigma regulatory factor (Ser/Thr protein kinase)